MRRLPVIAAMALVAGVVSAAEVERPAPPPFPLGERLHYRVKWLGLHCGDMQLESFQAADGTYRVVMTARTTRFFDGIYRVRSRIESRVDPVSRSSIWYRERTEQEKERELKTEMATFDPETGVVTRHKDDGEVETFTTERRPVYDPLAFIFRIRDEYRTGSGPVAVNLVGSDEVIPILAEKVDLDRVRTPLGRREAIEVKPRTSEEMLFSRKGDFSLWLSQDERRLPLILDFDLSFGRLVAKLEKIEERPAHERTVAAGDDGGTRAASSDGTD